VLADSPDTRAGFSKYLAEITYFDSQVGELLALLDQHGQRENTLVVVLSEQGNSFPFAKWTCYDAGLQSACIVRWPGKVQPGAVSDALIEYVDVVPTFLEAAGQVRPNVLDGRSFLAVLTGEAGTHKTHVFGLQTTRGINNGSDYFGIRSVRDARYRYICNLTPEIAFQNAATNDRTFKTWAQMAAGGDEHARRLVHDYQHRPAEELYDCQTDPWNRTNRIADAKLAAVRDNLRARLDAWMKQQGDEGQATEMKALERMPGRARDPAPASPTPKRKKQARP
jgi:N-sulfoglucosamine sulfohydrolase